MSQKTKREDLEQEDRIKDARKYNHRKHRRKERELLSLVTSGQIDIDDLEELENFE